MQNKIKDSANNVGSKDFFKDEKSFLFDRLKFILDNKSELVGELKYIIENRFVSNPVFKKDNKGYTYSDIYTPLIWVAFLKLGYYHLFEYLSDDIKNELKNESRFGKAKEFYESISKYHVESHDDYNVFYDEYVSRRFIRGEKVVIPESSNNLVLTMFSQEVKTNRREEKLKSIKKVYNIKVKDAQMKKKHRNQKNKNVDESELNSLESCLLELVEREKKKVQLKLSDLDRYIDSFVGFGKEVYIKVEVKLENLKEETKNLLNKDQDSEDREKVQIMNKKTIYFEFETDKEKIRNIIGRIEGFKIETKKAEDKKAEDKKAEDKKAEDKKAEDKKAEDKKAEDKKEKVVDFLILVKDIKFIEKMKDITKTEKMEKKAIKFGTENRQKNIEGQIVKFSFLEECEENKKKRKSIKESIIDFWLKTEQIRDFEDLFSWCDLELCTFICSYIYSDVHRYYGVKYKFKERFKVPGCVWPYLWKEKVLKKSLTETQESVARNNEQIVDIVKELNLTKECLIQYIDVDKNDKETKKDLLDYYNSVLNNEDDKEDNRFNLISNLFFVYIFQNIFELPEEIGPFFGTCLCNSFYSLKTPKVIIESFYNAIKLKREDMRKFLLSDIARKTLSSADRSLSKSIEKGMKGSHYGIPKKTLFGASCNLSKKIADALVYLAQGCGGRDSKSFRKMLYDLELDPEQKIGLGFVAIEENNNDKLNILVDLFKKDFIYSVENIRFILGYEEIYIKKFFLTCTKIILEDLKSKKEKCLSEKTKSAFDRILEKNKIEYKEICDLFFDMLKSEEKLFVLLLLQNEKFAKVLKYIPVKQFLSTLLDFGNDFKFKATLSKLLENIRPDDKFILDWLGSLEDKKKIVALEAIVKNENKKKIALLETAVNNDTEFYTRFYTRFYNILKFENIKQNISSADVKNNLFDVIKCVLELNYLSDESGLLCVLKCLEDIPDYKNKSNLLIDIIESENVLKIVKQNDNYTNIFRCIENVLNKYDQDFYLLKKVMENKYICDQKNFNWLMTCVESIKDYDKKAKLLVCILDQQEEKILKLVTKNENHERIFEYARDAITQATNFAELFRVLFKHCCNQKEFNFFLDIIDNTYCLGKKMELLYFLFSSGNYYITKFLEDDNTRKNIFLKVKQVAVDNDYNYYFLSIFRYVLSYSIRNKKEDGIECLIECLKNMNGLDGLDIKILLFKEFIIEPYVKEWAQKNDNHSKIFSCFKNLLLEEIDLEGIDSKKLLVFAIKNDCICTSNEFEWLFGYIENMIDCEKKDELLRGLLRGIEFIAQNSSEEQEAYESFINKIKEIRNDNKEFVYALDDIFCEYTKFTRAFFKNIKDDYLDKMGDFDEKVELLYYMIKKKDLYMLDNQTELVEEVKLEYIFKALRALFEENKQFEKSDKFIDLIKLLSEIKFISICTNFDLLLDFIKEMSDSDQKLKLLCCIASCRMLEGTKKKEVSREAIFKYSTWDDSKAFKKRIADKSKLEFGKLKLENKNNNKFQDALTHVIVSVSNTSSNVFEKYHNDINSRLEVKLDDGLEEEDIFKYVKDAISKADFDTLIKCFDNMKIESKYKLKKEDINECISQTFAEIGSDVIEKYRAYAKLKSDCNLEQKQISDCINDTISKTNFDIFKKCVANIKLKSNYSPEQIEMIIDNLRSEDDKMRLEPEELFDFLFSDELSENQLDAVVYLINKDSLCEDVKKNLLLDVFIKRRFLCKSVFAADECACNKIFVSPPSESAKDSISNLLKIDDLSSDTKKTVVDEYICNKIFASSLSKSVKDLISNLLKINDLSSNARKTIGKYLSKKDKSFIESKLHSKLENKNLKNSKKPICNDKIEKIDAEL